MKRVGMLLGLLAATGLLGCDGASGPDEAAGPAAPVLALLAPADGAELPAGPVAVAGTARAEAGIASLSVVLDDGPAAEVAVAADGSFSAAVAAGEGPHEVRLVLRDVRGAVAEATRGFTVLQAAAPSLALLAPADGAELAAGLVRVEGTAIAEAGIASLSLAVDGGAAFAVAVEADGVFSAEVDPGEGSHTLRLVLTDLRDRTAERAIAFTVLPVPDTTPPTVAVDPVPAVITVRQIAIRGVAADDRALASVRLVHGDAAKVLAVGDDGTFAWTGVPFRGENVVRLVATDLAGNESTVEVPFFYGQIASAGAAHTGVIRDGALWAWGRHNKGQVGAGGEMSDANAQRTPQPIAGLPPVHWIAFAQNHSVAVGLDGSVWTWGANDDGQLGLGSEAADDRVSRATPQQVPGITDAVAAAGGFNHTLVLREDGTVVAFGANGSGQLGDGTTAGRSWPMPVQGVGGIVKVIGGSAHSAALAADGTVYLFGRNTYGNLAQGGVDGEPHPAPAAAQGLAPAVDLASGRDHVVALHADGSASAWGLNASGQLGDGTEENRGVPAPVRDLAGAVAVNANGNYTLARKPDGTLWGWGQAANNQLGTESAGNRATPTEPAFGLRDVVAVGTGATHVVAVRADGTVFTWGWNIHGALGNPLLANNWAVPTPTALELD